MIYAVRALETPYIKFGIARGIERRLTTMQTGCPYELRAVAFADWPNQAERQIHAFLKADRVRGEWFKQGKDADTVIDALRHSTYEQWTTLLSNLMIKRRSELRSLLGSVPSRLSNVLQFCATQSQGMAGVSQSTQLPPNSASNTQRSTGT